MTDVIMFHHALGPTPGVHALADRLRAAGHVVHVPDLYAGRTFDDLDAGVAHAWEELGFATLMERGKAAVADLPAEVVYAGSSLGAMPAMLLAMTRPGAKGAVLLHAAASPADVGGEWPAGVPLQIHTMADDPMGDAEVAVALGESIPGAEAFLYPGDRHLFTDETLPSYDAEAAALVEQRVLAFLAAAGA